jgi:Na+-translocating ferredoxin:NAD+ oxidoreductase RnfG subunit
MALAGLVPAVPVLAADYLSLEAAQHAVFPLADRFSPCVVNLTDEQRRSIATLAGPQPQRGNLQIWTARHGDEAAGYFFIDEVIGRQSMITYAVGIDPAGVLTHIEILAYRESHGGEIRNRNWRAQFEHRAGLEQLKFRTDIKNIAGATLSSEHVTQGVRWLVALWQTALREPLRTSSIP